MVMRIECVRKTIWRAESTGSDVAVGVRRTNVSVNTQIRRVKWRIAPLAEVRGDVSSAFQERSGAEWRPYAESRHRWPTSLNAGIPKACGGIQNAPIVPQLLIDRAVSTLCSPSHQNPTGRVCPPTPKPRPRRCRDGSSLTLPASRPRRIRCLREPLHTNRSPACRGPRKVVVVVSRAVLDVKGVQAVRCDAGLISDI